MTIGTAIVVIGIIYFMIISPGFRKMMVVLLIGVAVTGAWLVLRPDKSNQHWQEQHAASESSRQTIAIALDDLALSDIKLERPIYAIPDGGSLDEWILKGIVTNKSTYSLGDLTFEISVTDCPSFKEPENKKTDNNCRIVGQQEQSASVNAPPGQTRAFSSYAIRFAGMPAPDARFNRRFSWKVTKISASSASW